MARTRAADYSTRRAAIVERAARLYSQRGFQAASISDLAKLCRISKSLIYHYYSSKEDILFDIMHSHVASLLEAAEAIIAERLGPEEKLRLLTREFLRLYVGAAARQKILLNELDNLPKDRQSIIIGIQRRLIVLVQAVLREMRPDLMKNSQFALPTAMLYFGMINWTHTWMDASGAMKPGAIAELASDVFLQGFKRATQS
jgi:AcrR family transcriptional regulator